MLKNSRRDDDSGDLQPVTVVAVRRDNASGWQLRPLRCELHYLPNLLTEFGLDGIELRLIFNGAVLPCREESIAAGYARCRGWDWDKETDGWFPVDEPLPTPLPGEPTEADILFSLQSVLFGCIEIVVEAGSRSLTLWLGDVHDSPAFLVRFIQVLDAGGLPHASLAEGSGRFIVQGGPNPDQCRFYVEGQIDRNDFTKASFDILIDRTKLLHQFRNLARAIAGHPAFAHLFICHACLPHDEYDRVDEAAELEWKEGVRSGKFPDDFDAEERFVAARIVAEVPLPEECAKEANEQREMLRSLQIPTKWLVKYGLVRWAPAV